MMDFVAQLPPEVTEEIFSYLNIRDLIACAEVSISWRLAADNPRLWKKMTKSVEGWLLPDYKVKRCDIVNSSFYNSLSLESSMPKDDSQFNWLKFSLCQRNSLKHNWTHGIYTDNWLQVRGCVQYIECDVFYPSKSPYDCLYYPFMGKFKDGSYAFSLIHLDAKPKIVGTLFTTNNPSSVHRLCVMRDCLVWFNGYDVKYFSLFSEFHKSVVHTLGSFDVADSIRMLTMDSCNIVAGCLSVKVWCKETLSLKFVIDPEFESSLHACWLYDGCLILASRAYNFSTIKVYNIKNDVSMLQNQYIVPGSIEWIRCNNQFIFLHYFDNLQGIHVCEVHDKETYSVKFSQHRKHAVQFYLTHEACNKYISFGNYHTNKIELLNFSSMSEEMYELTQFNGKPHFIFDNIVLVRGERSFEVWDWKKSTKLYNFPTVDSPGTFIVHVSAARVVIVDIYCNFQIYSFS